MIENRKLWVVSSAIRKTIDPKAKLIEVWLEEGLYDPDRKDMSSVMRKCRLALGNQEYYVADGREAKIACSAIEGEGLVWYVFKGAYDGKRFLVSDVRKSPTLESGKWLSTKTLSRTIYRKEKGIH